MRSAILGFVVGAACLQARATLPDHPALGLAGVVLLFLCAIVLTRRARPAVRGGVAALSGAATGFLWAALLAQAALAPQLEKADEGRDVTLIGTIDSLPNRLAQGVRFNFAVEQVQGNAVKVPPRISLAWYSGQQGDLPTVGDVQPGERWELTVRLQRPHGNAIPASFDYPDLRERRRPSGRRRTAQQFGHCGKLSRIAGTAQPSLI